MTDFLGYGREKRREGNLKILAGDVTFRCVVFSSNSARFIYITDRDGFREMLESVTKNGHTFEECKEVLKKSWCWYRLV